VVMEVMMKGRSVKKKWWMSVSVLLLPAAAF
jgi:hypothetical protein